MTRHLHPTLLFAALLPLFAAPEAQAALELSGQFRNLLFVTQVEGEGNLADTNGVRLDLQSSAGPNDMLRFRGSIDLSYTFGSLEALRVGAALSGPEGIPLGTIDPRLHVDLFRAFVQLRTPRLEAALGRQRIAWGTGLFLRPTDAFEPNDLFDPYRELTGVDALRLTIPLSSAVYLEGVARLDTTSGGSQVGVAAGIRHLEKLEVAASAVLDGIHDRQQIGLSLKGTAPIKYWFEGVYRYQNHASTAYGDTHEVLIETGLEYTVPVQDGLSLGAEYLFLSDGDALGGGADLAEAWEDYRVLQGRDYGYLQAALAIQDRLNAGIGLLINVDDGSSAILPHISGRPLPSIELTLGAQLFLGRSGDEFSRKDVAGGGRGAALYYLLTTWYF